MMGATWLTRLQRALIAVILTVLAVGLGYLEIVVVAPTVASSFVGSPPANAGTPPLSQLAPPPPGATPIPAGSGAGGPGRPGGPGSGATATATSAPSLREVQKVVLAASSVDGPALWVRPPAASATGPGATASDGSSAGSGNAIGGVLAWADTGPYHRLHLLLSPDGLLYNRELLLPANAIARPSVVVAPVPTSSVGPSATQAEVVILAWTGIDPAHSLNLMYDALGIQQVLTLPQGSAHAPALALFAGQLWLAWTGTEPSHPLHIRAVALTGHGLVPGADTLLEGYASRAAPALAPDDRQHQLLLTWTAAGTPWMRLATSSDGHQWHLVPTAGLLQASSAGSTILALPASAAPAASPLLPGYYWAWPGNDRWHKLTLTRAPTITAWASPVTIKLEWCVGAPGLGFVGSTGHMQQILLAWTGIDPEHHLTLAVFQMG
jgi:hypothetical protein